MSLIISQPLIKHCIILGYDTMKIKGLAEIEKFNNLNDIGNKINIWSENEFL